MGKGSFVNNTQSKTIRSTLDTEFDSRLSTKTTTASSNRTASSTTKNSVSSPQTLTIQDRNTTFRLDPTYKTLGDGIRSGRIRDVDEDQTNLETLANIENAESLTTTSSIPLEDLKRQRMKLQMRCNHKYSSDDNKCIFCGKDRSSHVYDQ